MYNSEAQEKMKREGAEPGSQVHRHCLQEQEEGNDLPSQDTPQGDVTLEERRPWEGLAWPAFLIMVALRFPTFHQLLSPKYKTASLDIGEKFPKEILKISWISINFTQVITFSYFPS